MSPLPYPSPTLGVIFFSFLHPSWWPPFLGTHSCLSHSCLLAYLPGGLHLFSPFSPIEHVLINDKIPSLLNIYEPKTAVSALYVLIDLIPVRTYAVGPSFALVFKMGKPRPLETKSLSKITELFRSLL